MSKRMTELAPNGGVRHLPRTDRRSCYFDHDPERWPLQTDPRSTLPPCQLCTEGELSRCA